ncbi:MAG TPA: hypothetical protein VJ653_06405 [Acidimicrobiales bacterium]|nr:hypothetical protein [Acidimicrobiales bacterium]
MRRLPRDESGQAGMEVIPFGLLTFVVGALLIANAWAVIDAKMAVSAAAREATRAFVEAAADPEQAAEAAGRSAIAGFGRNPDRLELDKLEGEFNRCETVRYEARYQIPAVRVPFVGGFGSGFTATARHAEVVDPYRTGVPPALSDCASAP